MSIKIYNGYQLPMMNLMELNKFILKVQADLRSLQVEQMAKLLAQNIVSDVDDLLVFGKEEFLQQKEGENTDWYTHTSIIRRAYTDIQGRYMEIQKSGYRDPIVDFDFDLVVIPDDSKILVLLYTEQKVFREYWESLPEVSDYGYWNNVEKEEGITEEEWKQREKEWKRLWPNDKKAKEIGMTLSIIQGIPQIYDIPVEMIHLKAPSFKERLDRVSRNQVFIEKYNELFSESNKPMKTHMAVNRWLETSEGEVRLNEVMNLTKKVLLPEITKDIWRKSFAAVYEAN